MGSIKINVDEKILEKGPLAVIECYQRIPCNPCETSCPNKAIFIGEDISEIPKIDYDKCTGCGICMRNCPGLAIFIVNGKENTITLPYEFLPLPKEGEIVKGVDRNGKEVCEAKVVKVLKFPDKKNLITIKVPKSELMNVRHIKLI